jgi:hypothetical protein
LKWGANETQWGTNSRMQRQNNHFGLQQGTSGSIPCSISVIQFTGPTKNACFSSDVTWGTQLMMGLTVIPHTLTNPNPENVSYGAALMQSMILQPANQLAWMQSIASHGWNDSSTYASNIVENHVSVPEIIECITKLNIW